MSLITQACLIPELASKATGADVGAGTLLLGNDGLWHPYPATPTTVVGGLSLILSAIPAPTATQSPWGVNTLGEIVHYAPGLGWRIVDNRWFEESLTYVNTAPTQGAWQLGASVTAPRAGRVIITGWAEATIMAGGVITSSAVGLARNGAVIEQHNVGAISPVGTPFPAAGGSSPADIHMAFSFATTVTAGEVFSAAGLVFSTWQIRNKIQITYTN
jgi:hypothetical protein